MFQVFQVFSLTQKKEIMFSMSQLIDLLPMDSLEEKIISGMESPGSANAYLIIAKDKKLLVLSGQKSDELTEEKEIKFKAVSAMTLKELITQK